MSIVRFNSKSLRTTIPEGLAFFLGLREATLWNGK
jgi:hypothetical protein